MIDPKERPNRFPWPPVVYPLCFIVAAVLTWLAPSYWPPSPLSDILLAIGGLLVIGGVALYASALVAFSRVKTTKAPHHPVTHLVTSGPFKLSRNPIYLGAAMVLVGIGLILGSWWFLAAAIIAALLTTKLAIEGEERHLEARFGKRYRDYRKRVRRWF
jgi:protein-S-isoprenylcysteine O-methyltransferase Ste14